MALEQSLEQADCELLQLIDDDLLLLFSLLPMRQKLQLACSSSRLHRLAEQARLPALVLCAGQPELAFRQLARAPTCCCRSLQRESGLQQLQLACFQPLDCASNPARILRVFSTLFAGLRCLVVLLDESSARTALASSSQPLDLEVCCKQLEHLELRGSACAKQLNRLLEQTLKCWPKLRCYIAHEAYLEDLARCMPALQHVQCEYLQSHSIAEQQLLRNADILSLVEQEQLELEVVELFGTSSVKQARNRLASLESETGQAGLGPNPQSESGSGSAASVAWTQLTLHGFEFDELLIDLLSASCADLQKVRFQSDLNDAFLVCKLVCKLPQLRRLDLQLSQVSSCYVDLDKKLTELCRLLLEQLPAGPLDDLELTCNGVPVSIRRPSAQLVSTYQQFKQQDLLHLLQDQQRPAGSRQFSRAQLRQILAQAEQAELNWRLLYSCCQIGQFQNLKVLRISIAQDESEGRTSPQLVELYAGSIHGLRLAELCVLGVQEQSGLDCLLKNCYSYLAKLSLEGRDRFDSAAQISIRLLRRFRFLKQFRLKNLSVLEPELLLQFRKKSKHLQCFNLNNNLQLPDCGLLGNLGSSQFVC